MIAKQGIIDVEMVGGEEKELKIMGFDKNMASKERGIKNGKEK